MKYTSLENVGTDAAWGAMILEQGLALDGPLGIKTNPEREAQGESGGKQPQPTAGAALRGIGPPS